MHTTMAVFRVRCGAERDLARLLDRHHETIVRLGYGGDARPVRLLQNGADGPTIFEIFDWLDDAVGRAAQDPEVQAIWREIDRLCEERPSGPATDFPRVVRLQPGAAG
jgi:hypothetical protein